MICELSTREACHSITSGLPECEEDTFFSLDSFVVDGQFDQQESQESCHGEVMSFLILARKHAQIRQLRLRIPTVVCGSVLALSGLGLVGLSALRDCQLLFAVGTCLVPAAACFAFLGFLPSDVWALPRMGAFIVFYNMLGNVMVVSFAAVHLKALQDGTCTLRNKTHPCWFIGVLFALGMCDVIPGFWSMARISCSIRRDPSEIMLSKFWSTSGGYFMYIGITHIVRLILGIIESTDDCLATLLIAFTWPSLGTLMIFGVDFRRGVQSWFMSRGAAAVTAAGVADLVGGHHLPDILNHARRTFLAVRADRIEKDHIQDNHPNPTLRELTEKQRLGLVDAFVSHSWHDNADMKWQALQELRSDFKASFSREPTLWIDKYSINQNSIDASLACLPVYLAGCTELWILCGSTYLQRLWCIIEIYVFLEMGGDLGNLRVKILEDFDTEPRTYDARDAKCSLESDTERLHKVIHTTGYDRIHELTNSVFFRAQKGAISTFSMTGRRSRNLDSYGSTAFQIG